MLIDNWRKSDEKSKDLTDFKLVIQNFTGNSTICFRRCVRMRYKKLGDTIVRHHCPKSHKYEDRHSSLNPRRYCRCPDRYQND